MYQLTFYQDISVLGLKMLFIPEYVPSILGRRNDSTPKFLLSR